MIYRMMFIEDIVEKSPEEVIERLEECRTTLENKKEKEGGIR